MAQIKAADAPNQRWPFTFRDRSAIPSQPLHWDGWLGPLSQPILFLLELCEPDSARSPADHQRRWRDRQK